jgi:hypothetical protein
LRGRLTTVTPSFLDGFRNFALANAPSTVAQRDTPGFASHGLAHLRSPAASSSLARKAGRSASGTAGRLLDVGGRHLLQPVGEEVGPYPQLAVAFSGHPLGLLVVGDAVKGVSHAAWTDVL